MVDWQERVIMEKHSIDGRIGKLAAFLALSPKISAENRELLDLQLLAMQTYSWALASRIKRFE